MKRRFLSQRGRKRTPAEEGSRLSLFYRENREAIERGAIPERYERVASQVTGSRVLEMGSAEGTLSLLLAAQGRSVMGIEPNPDRASLAVQRSAAAQPLEGRLSLIWGDIRDHLPLLQGVETFVGMRCIYYLREDIERVFDAIAEHVREVVLTGNANRETRFAAGKRSKLGEHERYATLEGMVELLATRGYRVAFSEKGIPKERDPMIVARLGS